MEIERFDVVVCGCGSAGFCAAVAAARNGAKTAVIEKYSTPGGIMTVTGSNSVDQFNNPFLPENKMVIAGIGWEYVRGLQRDGFASCPDMNAEYRSHDQYGVKVNPVAAAARMDEMLLDAGVTLYYGQPVVSVATDDRRIRSVTVSAKSGLKTVEGRYFIDCTGDGDLSAWAGASFEAGDGNGHFQPGTLRYYPAVTPDKDDYVLNFGDNRNHVDRIDPTDSDNLTRIEVEARREMLEFMRRNRPDGERVMAAAPAVAPREGRRILGQAYMTVDRFTDGTVFPDSVCYSFWFVDIHREGQPSYIRYIKDGSTPTVRLGALLARDLDNLLTAGRCVSSDRETNSALRVKASCMAMGEAAGTAAALLSETPDAKTSDLDPERVRKRLHERGAIVPGMSPTRPFLPED